MIFILSSSSKGLEFWSVNYNWIYQNSESKGIKNINFLGEISKNWLENLWETNVY